MHVRAERSFPRTAPTAEKSGEWCRRSISRLRSCFVKLCADKHGNIAHTYKEPDEVFWKRVAEAQLEEFGKFLDPVELAKELDDRTTVLAKLAVEWREQIEQKGR